MMLYFPQHTKPFSLLGDFASCVYIKISRQRKGNPIRPRVSVWTAAASASLLKQGFNPALGIF
jgi:hypothetical protein